MIVRRGFDVAGGERFDIGRLTRDIVAAYDAAEAERLAAELAAAEAAEAEDN